MKILVIESSPHKNGASNLLAENFVRGARETGNTVTIFDVAKAALIATAWDSNEVKMQPLIAHYKMICHYLGFEDKGIILGLGCGTPSMTQRTVYPQKAYELGRTIK